MLVRTITIYLVLVYKYTLVCAVLSFLEVAHSWVGFYLRDLKKDKVAGLLSASTTSHTQPTLQLTFYDKPYSADFTANFSVTCCRCLLY